MFISCIALLTSHPRDDSYTPSRISVKAGTGVHDLQEVGCPQLGTAYHRADGQVRYEEFDKPNGWILISLRPMDSGEDEGMVEGPPIPAHHLRVVIVANHLNGKDTHVRGLKVFGPTK